MNRSLEQVLADAREDANRLRLHGHKAQAESIDRLSEDVAKAARDYLDWLDEGEARTRSGKSADWLRSHFAEWETQGLAEWRHKRRYYRRIVVPRRANLEAARAQAERDARKSA
jgi:hypothetical protein